ncbi:hypothetical protein KEM48_013645 [Puccinia striiformis f. sp. tritici PST-130]|nr:hypothetical protein KEM48_013645 [Puccinia striiformis f. sp. tritici PST-130]
MLVDGTPWNHNRLQDGVEDPSLAVGFERNSFALLTSFTHLKLFTSPYHLLPPTPLRPEPASDIRIHLVSDADSLVIPPSPRNLTMSEPDKFRQTSTKPNPSQLSEGAKSEERNSFNACDIQAIDPAFYWISTSHVALPYAVFTPPPFFKLIHHSYL